MTEMKKILYALLAAAATLSFVSCQEDFKEENGGNDIDDSNTIAFTLKSSVVTRSEGSSSVATRSFSLGDPIEGHSFFLEETVTYLDDIYAQSPETKGTPIYTENFNKMFASLIGVGYAKSGSSLSTVVPSGTFSYDSGSEKWMRKLTENPYESYDKLYFFMQPKDYSSYGVTNVTHSVNSSDACVIDFDYTAPLTATAQEDILFAGRPVQKSEARSFPVLFNHALSGVKFAIANVNDDNVKTYITSVKLTGSLYKSAHFQITTSPEGGSWVDDPDTHSSRSVVSLTGTPTTLESEEAFTQSFSNSDVVTFETGGQFQNNGKYPDSFAAAGNTNNLNDKNASMTFWFIPQAVPQDLTLEITFKVLTGTETFAEAETVTRSLNIGATLKEASISWLAGELRTYRLKADLIDVNIEDEVSGFEKTKVVITNTGNIDSYIRAAIVANWYGKDDKGNDGVALGYTTVPSNTNPEGVFIDAWKRVGLTGDNFGGVFSGLPGGSTQGKAKWKIGQDGFFYYTDIVPAGAAIPYPLFTSYSLSVDSTHPLPTIYYLSNTSGYAPFTDLRLEMEIAVQAIETTKVTSTGRVDFRDFSEAWSAALGHSISFVTE